MKKIVFMAAVMIFAAACKNGGGENEVNKVPAIDLANLDTTIAPGSDFYAYATAGWQRNHPMKPEYSRYGAFDILRENNEVRLNQMFNGMGDLKTTPGSNEQKIVDLYKQGLDSVRLNKEGAQPVLPYLNQLEEVKDLESFAVASAAMDMAGGGGAWGVYVMADLMESNMNVLYLGESGLALGNRDYYLKEENAKIREGYLNFLKKIFTLAGDPLAEEKAKDAFDFQMTIAVPYWSMVQQRDIQAQYNPMSTKELVAAYPNLNLDKYFEAYGIEEQQKIIVEQKSYFDELNKILAATDAKVLKHFLQAQLLSNACGSLDDRFSDASFEFFSKELQGITEQKPRWKRAMNVPNHLLGEAVGKMYVEKYFPEKDKERMLGMVKNMQKALGEHIDSLDWMSPQTKVKAQEKLAAFTVKIGYPDTWKDYSSLEIDPSKSYFENLRTASLWYTKDNLKELGKPVDRTKWGMSPQTVNAYYNPTTNEICFPAGILQPPFFNPDADDAVNYGAIGVVICHEMTHGFDDQGRLFDKDGNMTNWWTKEDSEAFAAKTKVLVEQFNKVEILPGVFANGAATLGENIADQGGLRISYTAMMNSFAGNMPKPIDGFTAAQRFYLAYATVWAQNITDKEKQRRVLTDVHSIGEQRVNETLKNIGTFFDAFGIKEGDPMFRPESERVIIW